MLGWALPPVETPLLASAVIKPLPFTYTPGTPHIISQCALSTMLLDRSTRQVLFVDASSEVSKPV